MKLIIAKSEKEVGNLAASLLLSQMLKKGKVNLSITAGKSPQDTYQQLIPLVKNSGFMNEVNFYNFDEVPLAGESDLGITMRDLNAMFFTPGNINPKNIHKLTLDNYENYDEKIEKDGGLDLIFMGLGEDGHYCGNVPNATEFNDGTRIVKFSSFQNYDPTLTANLAVDYLVTFGPKTVMRSRSLLMIVTGKHKAKAVKQLLDGEISPEFPASILKLHNDFTLILDPEAASLL